MKTWYIEIFQEAADLRNAGAKDKRLDVLDGVLKHFNAVAIPSDRTGTGNDNHYRVDMPDTVDKNEFLDYMMGTPEVITSNTVPVEQDRHVDSEFKKDVHDIRMANYKAWNECAPREDLYLARKIQDMIEQNTCNPVPPKKPKL